MAAGMGKSQRNGFADAARGAGDESDAIVKRTQERPPPEA